NHRGPLPTRESCVISRLGRQAPSGRVHGDRDPGCRTGIPKCDGETSFDPRRTDHAAMGSSQLLPSGSERTHNLPVQCDLASMRPNYALNLTVRPVTRLADLELGRTSTGRAQGARPSRPAG